MSISSNASHVCCLLLKVNAANSLSQFVRYNLNIIFHCILLSRRRLRCTQQRHVLDDSCSLMALLASACPALPSSIQEWNRDCHDLIDIRQTRRPFVSCCCCCHCSYGYDQVRPRHVRHAIHPREKANRFHFIVLSLSIRKGPTTMLVLLVSCSLLQNINCNEFMGI